MAEANLTVSAATAGVSGNNGGNEKAPGRMYAYEVPSIRPGKYEITTTQLVSAHGQQTQELVSTQPVQVKASSPYSLSSTLVYSYYPPNLRTVSATTLPHVVLKGATPWERSGDFEPSSAPIPWLALLLFTSDELCAPAELLSSTVKPSGTMALNLSLDKVNGLTGKFCNRSVFSKDELPAVAEGSEATADFIFVKSKAFRMYFERQDKSNTNGEQNAADLGRYSFLTNLVDTEKDDGTGHATTKLSTLIGHRARPYTTVTEEQQVYAHVVSIEGLADRVNWKSTEASDALVSLVSLFSWTFKWQKNNADESLEMFKHLSENIRPLAINVPQEDPSSSRSKSWMRERIVEGYTIVRHRDIAGEASMALYRGPFVPRPSRKAHIKSSMHGTDLEIIDVSAKMLDVSYSTAWELGRSLAGRDAKFSLAMASLRRQLCMKAVSSSRTAGKDAAKLMHHADDVVDSVLTRLDNLFDGSVASKLQGLPQLRTDEEKASRWQVPKPKTVSMAGAPGVMTQAKLRRHLEDFVQIWLQQEAISLCSGASASGEIPELAIVFNWIVNNLMSLKLIPATYLFPDPAILAADSISSFLVDDTWVDALVDGALSLANTMGGGDDPVRDQIRMAMNVYLRKAPASQVPIGGSGFVVRSGIVESFPDLEITATAHGSGSPLSLVYKSTHDDMILCLVPRGDSQKLVNYVVKLKLPPHQQRFALEGIELKDMTFTFELKPFVAETSAIAAISPHDLQKDVNWTRDGKITPDTLQFPPIWSWDTGLLVPHLIADMMDYFIDQVPNHSCVKQSKQSRSVYLATQLTDRDHTIIVPFNVTMDKEGTVRQMFADHGSPETDTRDVALLHDAQKDDAAENLPADNPSRPGVVEKSWFTKRVFSQAFPGESIPAQSNRPQQLVFAIKGSDSVALPKDVEILSMEVSIPVGEKTNHLLDPVAALPLVKALCPRQQWIAAVTYKKSDSELCVHLKPRGPSGVTLVSGVDASFVLLRATVNGVFGDDVIIKTKETYVRKVKGKGKNGEEVIVSTRKTVVMDSWVVSKE